MEFINELLRKHNITEYGIIDFEKVRLINPRLLPNPKIQSVLIALLPYRTGSLTIQDDYNMGLFGRIRDYHKVFAEIAEKIIPELKSKFGGEAFFFADHSPIAEKDAAAKCGLGFIGRNSLLINPKYGSYVFIGCFFLTEKLEEVIRHQETGCKKCESCVNACPSKAISGAGVELNLCLSCISQKKKKSNEELGLLQATKTVWGCDICQKACPHNKNTAFSEICEFDRSPLVNISAEILEAMDDETYRQYPFSYRPKKVITENCLTADGKRDIID